MDNTLSPEMQQQIRAYCDQVCAMNGLDHVREELQDHFEDKMLAYLSCSEKLQEQDAFLLVREHFGDAAALKSMFQTVHVRETGVTLGRRLAAVAAATLALTLVMRVVYVLVDPFLVMAQLNAATMWIGTAGYTLVHCADHGVASRTALSDTTPLEPRPRRRRRAMVCPALRDRSSACGSWSLSCRALSTLCWLEHARRRDWERSQNRHVDSALGLDGSGGPRHDSADRSLAVVVRPRPRTRSALGVALSVWLGLNLLNGVVSSLVLPGPGLMISDYPPPSGSGVLVLANPGYFGRELHMTLTLGIRISGKCSLAGQAGEHRKSSPYLEA